MQPFEGMRYQEKQDVLNNCNSYAIGLLRRLYGLTDMCSGHLHLDIEFVSL